MGDEWWKTIETNLRGAYNYLHHAVPELKKTRGTFLAITSRLGLVRMPCYSDYGISKYAVNRLVEFAILENPEIRAFSIHPGVIATEMYDAGGLSERGIPALDTPVLCAAVYMHL